MNQASSTNLTKATPFLGNTKLYKNLPGIIFVILIAYIANSMGKELPLIGSTVIAIALGVLIKNFLSIPVQFEPGISYSLKKGLKYAIILLGSSLSLLQVVQIGKDSLLIIVVVVTLGIILTHYIGRMLGLSGKLPLLLGVGTAICGATAIATVSPIMDSKDEETAFAITTIFIFNVIAVIAYPLLGLAFGMSDEAFGIWAGTAIQDTSSVVAAGYAYSDEAGGIATVVKLTRTLFLIPLAVLIGVMYSMKNKKETESKGGKVNLVKIFPFFILGFLGMAILNTLGFFSEQVVTALTSVSKFMILMAMAGVGLGADFKKMKAIGLRPIYCGLLASIIVGVISISLIYLVI